MYDLFYLKLVTRTFFQWVYFLHIGKAGGTILKSIFSNNKIQKNKIKVIGVSEKFKIYQLHPDQKYIFSIRNPITRYFSAFHARKIKSDIWTKEYYSVEGFGFYLYNDANQLAEDLYSKNLIKVFLSHISIRCIPIINENIYSWFNIEDLKKNLPQFIFENSTINEDWKFFSTKFGFEQNELLNHMHVRNKTFGIKSQLSEKAKENLKRYYKKDFEIYEYCLKIKNLKNF